MNKISILKLIKNNKVLKNEIDNIDKSIMELMDIYTSCKQEYNKKLLSAGVELGVKKRNELVMEHNRITFIIDMVQQDSIFENIMCG